jgi:hypothetical protein
MSPVSPAKKKPAGPEDGGFCCVPIEIQSMCVQKPPSLGTRRIRIPLLIFIMTVVAVPHIPTNI